MQVYTGREVSFCKKDKGFLPRTLHKRLFLQIIRFVNTALKGERVLSGLFGFEFVTVN
jgi:hypothetical protein